MRRGVIAIGIVIALPSAAARAQSATFASLAGRTGLPVQRLEIDWPHSAVEFSVRFMGLSTVRGAFTEFGGTVMYDTTDAAKSSVAIVISTASVSTNTPARDTHLKSPDFFDAKTYPLITFHSTRIDRTPSGFAVRGPLTMHGVTREVVIPMRQTHTLERDAWDNRRAGFVGQVKLSRREFGVMGTAFWNSEFDPGRMSVSDTVVVDLTIEAKVNNVERWNLPKGDSVLKVIEAQGLERTLREFRAASTDSATDAGKFSGPMLFTVGEKLMHRARYADAVEAFKLATELNPRSSRAHASLGEAYLMAGRRELAGPAFAKAARLDSTNTVATEYLRHLGARGVGAGGF